MLVDSHCHIDFPELANDLEGVLARMDEAGVGMALCAGVSLEEMPRIFSLVERHDRLFASVGVHPEYTDKQEPDEDTLIALARHAKVVAIGETGLDYYWQKDRPEWQRERFRTHIRAARQARKPLIIHMRDAADDVLRLLREEGAADVGGVMHCFTETCDIARQALDLGFHISLSGIVTFKNALEIKEVAKMVPGDRLLVETDAPYLAPVPYRGKLNQPSYVRHVAEEVARLRGESLENIAEQTTKNFINLFNIER